MHNGHHGPKDEDACLKIYQIGNSLASLSEQRQESICQCFRDDR